jgi:hypothetical protein
MRKIKLAYAASFGVAVFLQLSEDVCAQQLDPNSSAAVNLETPLAAPTPSPEMDRPAEPEPEQKAARHSVAFDVPRVAYTDTAFGSGALTLGAAGFGELRSSSDTSADPHFGGGIRIWGSPIDRLLFVLDAQRRDSTNEFAPAVTAQVRFLGSERAGWALGALVRYKTEGFAELEGEMEGGLLASLSQRRFHGDLNVVIGGDFDGHESDGELLARAGYDVLPFLRLGAEGRGRYRLAGEVDLPGGRSWDAFGGAQAFAFYSHYFGAVTVGPSTVGMVNSVGWSMLASAGGVMF